MTKCKQRSDIHIPVICRGEEDYIQIKNWYHCEQPDELNNEEYNVKIAYKGETVYGQSIDLKFKE